MRLVSGRRGRAHGDGATRRLLAPAELAGGTRPRKEKVRTWARTKTPTDAGTPVEDGDRGRRADSRCWRTSNDEGRSSNGKARPRGNWIFGSRAARRGHRQAHGGFRSRGESHAAPRRKADRKKHVGVIVAAVVFAMLLIGAGVAYSVLAPTVDDKQIEVTGTDAVETG